MNYFYTMYKKNGYLKKILEMKEIFSHWEGQNSVAPILTDK